jgi:hypothetical protein
MPVLVGGQWLNEARAFLRGLAVPSLNEPGSLENAVGRRRAHGHNVAVEHHESEPTIALQRELPCELHDRISLPAFCPFIRGAAARGMQPNERLAFLSGLAGAPMTAVHIGVADVWLQSWESPS